MEATVIFSSFNTEDGPPTRKNAAKWMERELAEHDEENILNACFTEDNNSTTAWIILKNPKKRKKL